jgi:hypothetical protein
MEGAAMEQKEALSAREVEAMAGQYERGKGGSSETGERDRFPVLTAMSTTLRIIGWLMVAGAAGLFFVQVMPWLACITETGRPQQPGGWGSPSCGVAVVILAPTIASLVGGFCTIAFGEVIGVFRAIEGNTHQLISSVEQAWNRIKLTAGGEQH